MSEFTRERITAHSGASEPDESWGRSLVNPASPSVQGALLYGLGPGLLELGSAVDLVPAHQGVAPRMSVAAGYRWVL